MEKRKDIRLLGIRFEMRRTGAQDTNISKDFSVAHFRPLRPFYPNIQIHKQMYPTSRNFRELSKRNHMSRRERIFSSVPVQSIRKCSTFAERYSARLRALCHCFNPISSKAREHG